MRCRKRPIATVLGVVLGAVLAGRAESAPRPICYDSSSPSASLDAKVAAAAQRLMGLPVAVIPYDGSSGISERYFRTLGRVRCSLIMGYPVDSIDPDPPPGLSFTHPYLATSYVIASMGRPRSLASIPRGASVSVGSSTVPNFYLVGALGPVRPLVSDVHLSQDGALDALVRHQTTVAMVWAPSVAHYRATHPGAPRIFVHALPIPHARWGVAALYDAANAAGAAKFDAAIATLRANGTLTRYYTQSGLESM